jgi:hypothetical protein
MKTFLNRSKSAFEIPFNPLDENTNKDNILSGLLNIITLIAVLYVIPFIAARSIKSPESNLFVTVLLVIINLRFAVTKGYTKFVSPLVLFVI